LLLAIWQRSDNDAFAFLAGKKVYPVNNRGSHKVNTLGIIKFILLRHLSPLFKRLFGKNIKAFKRVYVGTRSASLNTRQVKDKGGKTYYQKEYSYFCLGT